MMIFSSRKVVSQTLNRNANSPKSCSYPSSMKRQEGRGHWVLLNKLFCVSPTCVPSYQTRRNEAVDLLTQERFAGQSVGDAG